MQINYLIEDDEYCIADDPNWEEPEYDYGYNPYEDPRYVPDDIVKTYYFKKDLIKDISAFKSMLFNTIVTTEIVANTLSSRSSIQNVKILSNTEKIKGSDISTNGGNNLICVRTSIGGKLFVGNNIKKFGRFNWLATIIDDSVYILDRDIAFINNSTNVVTNDRFTKNTNPTRAKIRYCYKFNISERDLNYYKEQFNNIQSAENNIDDIIDVMSDSYLVHFGKHLEVKFY